MSLTVRFDGLDRVELMLSDIQKQIPFAQSKACNDLAFRIRDAQMQTIANVFNNPKPQTVRNIKVFKGSKDRPGATIAFDQTYAGDEYMRPHVFGGPRRMKRSERNLGSFYVPGKGAELDQYGNLKAGQVTQILSMFGALSNTGYMGNATENSKRKKGTAKRDYFIATVGKTTGVWQRITQGPVKASFMGPRQKASDWKQFSGPRSSYTKLILAFRKSAPIYRKRYPFFEVCQEVIDREGQAIVEAAVKYAIDTAKV